MEPDPLKQRVNERKVYEEVVEMVVDYVYKTYSDNEQARLRIYTLISENFKGMVKVLRDNQPKNQKSLINSKDEDG